MSLEIGGGNGIQPLMAAAHLGLPVVDADTMGRAYPEAQMTSVAVGELRKKDETFDEAVAPRSAGRLSIMVLQLAGERC
jgi:DUF917 family protein